MREMSWDENLATKAQEWADTCPDGHSGVYGENIFWQLGDVPLDGIGRAASESWASERELQDIDSLSPFVWDVNTGHWTQMIWADTDKVRFILIPSLDFEMGNMGQSMFFTTEIKSFKGLFIDN